MKLNGESAVSLETLLYDQGRRNQGGKGGSSRGPLLKKVRGLSPPPATATANW